MELIGIDLDVNRLQGRENFTLTENDWLKIKISENFILQAKVPPGKLWTGDVLVMIDETDV